MIFLYIIGIIGGWFAAGFMINVIVYSGQPEHKMEKSGTAKTLHIILNILTIIALISVIVG